ncbi:DUF3857 domain-containing protein [Sphingomonas leidyi]|uniref:DUF3857 domain-containing protein n=1 Tax=Sphingomonas leidyi TaxID=68569 RepID=UPI0036D2F13D
MYRNALASILFLGVSGVAHAGEKPLYQPVPDWVRLAPEPAATGLTDDAPAMVIGDVQARIADGQSWTYYERATRLASILAVSQAGTINLEWHPAHGDLMVHGVDILRGGKRIDALKGKSFTVLRREQGLDEMKFDGRLTATLAVEGLQVGDVLDLRYSVTMRDPALGGNAVIMGPVVAEPIKVGFVRTRLLWPTDQAVKWKTYPVGAEPQVRDAGGWHELVFKLPVARQPEMPARMPGRFARPPIAEATTFADWQSVSKAMAPLYRVDGLIAPGSALAAEVAKIAAAEKDPRKRTAAALALVQGKVRYLFRGMDNGNYVPQTPAETWTTKYGDCKAKTLLLLAILRELGIEAEPAAANLANGDLVAERLASPAAFNHVFVLARVGGQLLWLDGTGTGTRLEDIDDVLPFDWVLPLRAEGAGLLQVPARAPVRATGATVFDIDLTGGIDVPAPFEMKVTTRGAAEGGLKALMGLRSKESLLDMFRNLVPAFGQDMLLTGSDVSFDEASGTATIALSGILNRSWRYQDGRFRLDAAAPIAYQIPDRTRANWKDIPIATGNPMRTSNAMRVRLPEMGGYVLEGDAALDATLPGGKRVRAPGDAGRRPAFDRYRGCADRGRDRPGGDSRGAREACRAQQPRAARADAAGRTGPMARGGGRQARRQVRQGARALCRLYRREARGRFALSRAGTLPGQDLRAPEGAGRFRQGDRHAGNGRDLSRTRRAAPGARAQGGVARRSACGAGTRSGQHRHALCAGERTRQARPSGRSAGSAPAQDRRGRREPAGPAGGQGSRAGPCPRCRGRIGGP